MTMVLSRTLRYKDYCVLPNVLRSKMSKDLANYERITLVVHLSSDYLDERIVEQVGNQKLIPSSLNDIPHSGLFSTDKFTFAMAGYSIDICDQQIMKYAPHFEEKLSAHLIYRYNNSCMGMPNSAVYEPAKLYPVNVARNVARLLSSTKYILIADYEYIFSEDFEARMLRIARNLLEERPKTALVFRIFEAKGTIDEMPRSKDDLYAAYRRGDAVEFHSKYAKGAHSIPGLKEWFERNCSHEQSAPDTVLPYKRYDWEPQFVALNTIPFHDENFPYPMRDNTELRWEMCRLSYKFVLVDDLFIVHPGIKTNPGKTQALRKIAWRRFHYALRQFNVRMQECCPHTKASCPRFQA
ncbi:unnamed protein product [Toxocara canis]|uniref:Beta-1,4-glucuronyltransferase 1 n=1 Tax=Toxocara canis TaxID=6265 RepID=A0A183V7I3_TOXCA|nr:unnamed protein product [Toxocara canis]